MPTEPKDGTQKQNKKGKSSSSSGQFFVHKKQSKTKTLQGGTNRTPMKVIGDLLRYA